MNQDRDLSPALLYTICMTYLLIYLYYLYDFRK